MFYIYKLWSLLDMLQIFADEYINIGSTMAYIQVLLHQCAEKSEELDGDLCEQFRSTLKLLQASCDKLKLRVSSGILNKAIIDLPRSERELEIIMRAIKEEIQTNLFLFVPLHRANYYKQNVDKVMGAFKGAANELVHAGNCYATGEYTACVFHSMRAAEIGLRSLAKYLDIDFPFPIELADWKNIIDKIESEIKKKQQLPKSFQKDEELRFCSDAATHFRYIKDAYRIFVAHARETYEEDQALNIMEHTKEFLESISIKLKEPIISV